MAEKYNKTSRPCECIQFSKSTSKSAAFKPSVASPLNQTQYNLNANQFHQQALLVLTDFLLRSLVSRNHEASLTCWRSEDL